MEERLASTDDSRDWREEKDIRLETIKPRGMGGLES
jgi:hypothetical protein